VKRISKLVSSKLHIMHERISNNICAIGIQLLNSHMKENFQLISTLKTLLKANGRISFRGSFYVVKGKAFETGGEISKS
jgi:hypothetical protein